jgi:hypothetical protein
MNLAALNKICFTICIICIVLGTVLAISMIWVTYPSDFLWKFWSTNGVIFLAAVLTLIVSKVFGGRSQGMAQVPR